MATSPIGLSGTIDVNSIVSQLMSIERQPLNRLQTTLSGIQTKLSEIGKLQSAMDKLRDAARGLTELDTWRAARANSSDDALVEATASSGALNGSYSVTVGELAKYQTIVTNPQADAETVLGGGKLTFTFGSEVDPGGGKGTVFTPDPKRTPVEVNIADGSNLGAIRDAVNAADAGVVASLVTDSAGTRLMLRSAATGAEQAFAVSVADNDGQSGDDSGLSMLRYDPGASFNEITRVQSASDAEFGINGLSLTSATNRPDGAIENVTLALRQKTAAAVEIGVETDTDAIREKVDAFVGAYNELNALIGGQTRFDAESGIAGPLQGNRTVLLIQSRLRETLQSTFAGGEFASLSQVGIEIQRDGSLAVNGGKFDAAAATPEKLAAFFSNSDADAGKTGIARRLDTLLGDMLGVDGAITGATDSLRARQDSVEDQQDRFNVRLAQIESRLRRQYTALDSNLSSLGPALAAISQLSSQ